VDHLADCGGCDVEFLCGLAKAQVSGCSFECFQRIKGWKTAMHDQVRFSYPSSDKYSFVHMQQIPQSMPIAASQLKPNYPVRSKQAMSSTVSGNHSEHSTLGARVFKDLCEALALARAKRSEYFNRLFCSAYRRDRSETGIKGHIK
jgi:hypothetical protein